MSALANPRHERFAQELAKGATADDAYVEAGFKANRGNAATLKAKQNISNRVSELLDRAATRAVVTVANVTERLLAIATLHEKSTDAARGSVARAALMDACKLNGLVIDRSKSEVEQTTHLISDRPLSAEEWAEQHAQEQVQ
jgi:hypothetical protein